MSELRKQLQEYSAAYTSARHALDEAQAQAEASAQDRLELRQQLADRTAAAGTDRGVLMERLRAAEADAEAAAAAEQTRAGTVAELQTTLARQEQELGDARAALLAEQEKQQELQSLAADSVPKQRTLADAFNFVPNGSAANGTADGHRNRGESSRYNERVAVLEAAAAEAQRDAADAHGRLAAAAEEAAAREAQWEEQASRLRASLAEAQSKADRTSQQLEARFVYIRSIS